MAGEILGDRIFETTTTTGTGTVTLGGAPSTKYVTFKVGLGNLITPQPTYYCIFDDDNFEVGAGIVTPGPPDTLSRPSIRSSSNSNAAVNWGPGTRNVICTAPGSAMLFRDDAGRVGVLSVPLKFQSTGFFVRDIGAASDGTIDAEIFHHGTCPATVAQHGYQKFSDLAGGHTGLILNWGLVTAVPANGSKADTLQRAFASVAFGAILGWAGALDTGAMDALKYTFTGLTTINIHSGNAAAIDVFYIAIGM